MSQPFEVLGHSSSLLFNAHGCSSDGNVPFSLLFNDTLFEYLLWPPRARARGGLCGSSFLLWSLFVEV